ncbi:hypothetical protein CK203_087281 [Vitis vinifera]|uniref:Uncharacterized protein n=1 Tax=Vitis vinifera TaxID=29760 RepID=A0A438BM30_VITVI|nr:hypothetical protein CK203_087281 [Vitis vinifera]
MKTFVSQCMSGEEELRSRLEQAEASLSAARRASEESAEALKEVSGRQRGSPNRASRGKETGGSYRSPPARGGGRDGLAEGGTQKEELEAEFCSAKGGTRDGIPEPDDEMYFFGYRCCMKKHGIKRDVPSIPPGEEEKLRRPTFHFEALGPYLAIVVSDCPLLIVGHPDGCGMTASIPYARAKECFLSDVRVWFDKPIGCWVAPPPTSFGLLEPLL